MELKWHIKYLYNKSKAEKEKQKKLKHEAREQNK